MKTNSILFLTSSFQKDVTNFCLLFYYQSIDSGSLTRWGFSPLLHEYYLKKLHIPEGHEHHCVNYYTNLKVCLQCNRSLEEYRIYLISSQIICKPKLFPYLINQECFFFPFLLLLSFSLSTHWKQKLKCQEWEKFVLKIFYVNYIKFCMVNTKNANMTLKFVLKSKVS